MGNHHCAGKFGSQQQVGQYTLGLAVAAPVFLLANLQLDDVVATDTRHEHSFGNYLILRLLTTAIAVFLVTGIALALQRRRFLGHQADGNDAARLNALTG